LVYPLLQEIDAEMARHAEKEHGEAKALLSELSAMAFGGNDFIAKMERLRKAVDEHVTEEEDEVLPMMEGAVEDAEAQRIGGEWERQKKELIAAG
jgi:hemerythrin-like domain-containing protein